MLIRKIEAKKILGSFNYSISFSDDNKGSSRLAMIYAENGCGKTNLLKAVKALLTFSRRSADILREVPLEHLYIDFEYINVKDSRKTELNQAERCSGRVELVRRNFNEENFEIKLKVNGETYSAQILARDSDINARRNARAKKTSPYEIMAKIHELREGREILYLGDDRISLRREELVESPLRRVALKSQNEDESGPMSQLLNRVERALNQASLESYSKDSRESNVYARVARSVMNGVGESKKNLSEIRKELESELGNLIQKARPMEKYDLISTSQLTALQDIIRETEANSDKFRSLQLVMNPYFESIQKQIDSLESAQRLIDTFIETVNSFLKRKTLHYSSLSGIEMRDLNQKEIDPDHLSSGEKHLLYLLSHALLAGSVGGVLLIDEPEISLGIDWQRGLMKALLECSGAANKSVQFIVASHSLQVMTSVGRERIVMAEEVD
jgi:hypothetical protein